MNTSRTVTGRWGGSLLMIGGFILPTVSYFPLSDPALHPTSPSVSTPVLVTVHTPLLPTSPYSRVELQPTSGPSTMSAPQCGTRFPLISRVRIHRMYSSVCSCVICDNKQMSKSSVRHPSVKSTHIVTFILIILIVLCSGFIAL